MQILRTILGMFLVLFDTLSLIKNLDWILYGLSIVFTGYLLLFINSPLVIIFLFVSTFLILNYVTKEINIGGYSLFVIIGLLSSLVVGLMINNFISNFELSNEEKLIKNVKYVSAEKKYYIVDNNETYDVDKKQYIILKANECKEVIQIKTIKTNITFPRMNKEVSKTSYKCKN